MCVSRHRAIKGKPHFHCISNKFVVSILFIGYQYNNIQNFNPRIILGLKPEFGSKMRVCMVWWWTDSECYLCSIVWATARICLTSWAIVVWSVLDWIRALIRFLYSRVNTMRKPNFFVGNYFVFELSLKFH